MPNLSQAAAIAQVPVRHADFAGVQQQDQKSMASVQFCLTYHAEFGQRLRVVGSHKNLGMLTELVTRAMLKHTSNTHLHTDLAYKARI